MRGVMVWFFILLLSTSLVYSQDANPLKYEKIYVKEGKYCMHLKDECSDFPNKCEICVENFEEAWSYVPENITLNYNLPKKVPIEDERIVIKMDESVLGELVIEDKIVKRFIKNKDDNATYYVQIENEDVIKEILASNESIRSFIEMIEKGRIKIEGVGWWNKFKAWLFTKLMVWGFNYLD